MRKSLAVLLVVATVWTAVPAMAAKATYTYRWADSFTLRDAPDDVQQSDGLGSYTGADVAAYVRDFANSLVSDDPTKTQDYMYVTTKIDGSRRMFLNNDQANLAEGSEGPIACVLGYAVFISDSTPDWYEALGAVGSTVSGWGTTGCYTAPDRGYHIVYDASYSLTGSGECLRMTRDGTNSLVLRAEPAGVPTPMGPPPCNAHIGSFVVTTDPDTGTTRWTFTSLGATSAPLELGLAMTPPRGRGKK